MKSFSIGNEVYYTKAKNECRVGQSDGIWLAYFHTLKNLILTLKYDVLVFRCYTLDLSPSSVPEYHPYGNCDADVFLVVQN